MTHPHEGDAAGTQPAAPPAGRTPPRPPVDVGLYPACGGGAHELCRGRAINDFAGLVSDCSCPCHGGGPLAAVAALGRALAAGAATVVVCDGSDAWERASARDRAAATRAAADAGWDWQPEPGVPSPAEAMLEVVASVRASDAEWPPS